MKDKTAMQQLIDWLYEYQNKSGSSQNEQIAKATELLEVEKQQHIESHIDGQICEGSRHPSSHEALANFTNKYNNQ